jgi:hypothetical protein
MTVIAETTHFAISNRKLPHLMQIVDQYHHVAEFIGESYQGEESYDLKTIHSLMDRLKIT